jgi:hypothetical protein
VVAAAVYRSRPAAVIVKPRAVGIMNAMLTSYEAGIIDEDTLNDLILKEIHRGSMLASYESVRSN